MMGLLPNPEEEGGVIDVHFWGYLAVKLLFLGEPVEGLRVEFIDGTMTKMPVPLLANERTDADGCHAYAVPVDVGVYTCRVEGQADVTITTVETPARPFVLVLPVGRPYFDINEAEGPPPGLGALPVAGPGPAPVVVGPQNHLGYLSVRILFLGEPVEGLNVRFQTIANEAVGPVPGNDIPTDADGIAGDPTAVAIGRYRVQIDGRETAEVTTVERPDAPFVIVLPVGRPYFDYNP